MKRRRRHLLGGVAEIDQAAIGVKSLGSQLLDLRIDVVADQLRCKMRKGRKIRKGGSIPIARTLVFAIVHPLDRNAAPEAGQTRNFVKAVPRRSRKFIRIQPGRSVTGGQYIGAKPDGEQVRLFSLYG